MKGVGSLVLILALVGCQSASGDARPETVSWSAQYDVPFDSMVSCLSANAAEPLTPAPQVSKQDGVARIVLAAAGAPPSVPEEYTVRRLDDRRSGVAWQRSQPVGTGNYFKDWSVNVAERCAKIYADFGAGAYGLRH